MRVPPEDRNQVSVVVDGHEYRQQRDGFFHVDNERHASGILQAGGYGKSWQTAPPPRGASGYRCPQCRRLKFFKVCGSCNVECEQEI